MFKSFALGIVALTAACSGPQQLSSTPSPAAADRAFWSEQQALVAASGGSLGMCLAIVEERSAPDCVGQAERFPMASVYKLPIAIAVLAKVEKGDLVLDASVVIRRQDLRMGRSPIAESFQGEQQSRTIQQLLEGMLVQSDNTASDLLLREVGGPTAVMQLLRARGVEGLRVDRSEGELAQIFEDKNEQRAMAEYVADPRDTSTPEAMIALLQKLHEGKLLGKEMTGHLRQMMTRAKPGRISLYLPEGTEVAHKTGTALGSINDVGLVTLADGRHLAVVIFVKGAHIDELERGNELIGKLAQRGYERVVRREGRR